MAATGSTNTPLKLRKWSDDLCRDAIRVFNGAELSALLGLPRIRQRQRRKHMDFQITGNNPVFQSLIRLVDKQTDRVDNTAFIFGGFETSPSSPREPEGENNAVPGLLSYDDTSKELRNDMASFLALNGVMGGISPSMPSFGPRVLLLTTGYERAGGDGKPQSMNNITNLSAGVEMATGNSRWRSGSRQGMVAMRCRRLGR